MIITLKRLETGSLGVCSELLYGNIKMWSLEKTKNKTKIKIKLKQKKVGVQNEQAKVLEMSEEYKKRDF